MSRRFRHISLGPHSRNLACQTLSGWLSLSPFERSQSLDGLIFRAALQLLLLTAYGHEVTPTVGRMKRLPASFGLYIEAIWSRISNQLPPLPPSFPSPLLDMLFPQVDVKRLNDWFVAAVLPRRKEIAVLHILRLCLAGVVESLILLDRLCYLTEKLNVFFLGETPGVPLDTRSWKMEFPKMKEDNSESRGESDGNCERVALYLIPIFEQSLSARNMAICGVKYPPE
jgi:hypothetical protein